ncbi:hypothetical protein ACFYPZ_14705 [Streptomyces sp. NPDC005506]|uniref:hypothetical protein n=1 Tax=unclassified Streptomyces TaxID=2593676 RepID=UPI0036964F3A
MPYDPERIQGHMALGVERQDRIVVAAGVSDPALTSIDTFDPHRSRRTASLASLGRSFALRTEPDESVNLAALQVGAEEVAGHLARALIAHHPSAARSRLESGWSRPPPAQAAAYG